MSNPWRLRMVRVALRKVSYFDHTVVFFVGMIESFHKLPEIIEFLEGGIENWAVWDSLEVHKKDE